MVQGTTYRASRNIGHSVNGATSRAQLWLRRGLWTLMVSIRNPRAKQRDQMAYPLPITNVTVRASLRRSVICKRQIIIIGITRMMLSIGTLKPAWARYTV